MKVRTAKHELVLHLPRPYSAAFSAPALKGGDLGVIIILLWDLYA